MRYGRTLMPVLVAVLAALGVAHGPASIAARADEPVRVRAGDHPGFGRLVFDVGGGVRYRMTRDGDRVVLRFDTQAAIGAPSSFPRNVVGFASDASQAEIRVRPGARVQPLAVANGVAIDVWDAPVPTKAPPAPAVPRTAGDPPPPPAGKGGPPTASPAPPTVPTPGEAATARAGPSSRASIR